MADSIGRALSDAERSVFTRPIPKTAKAQLNFLTKQAKGSTRELAQMLGVSPRQALRYRKGEARLPEARLRKAVEARWQPKVRQRARERIAQGGMVVEIRARFGFTAAPGSSDDPRMRNLVQPLPPEYGRQLLAAGTEADRRKVIADGLAEYYFRDRNSRAHGLGVELTDVENVQIGLF